MTSGWFFFEEYKDSYIYLLVWQKKLFFFSFFYVMFWKNSNKLFGQPNTRWKFRKQNHKCQWHDGANLWGWVSEWMYEVVVLPQMIKRKLITDMCSVSRMHFRKCSRNLHLQGLKQTAVRSGHWVLLRPSSQSAADPGSHSAFSYKCSPHQPLCELQKKVFQ